MADDPFTGKRVKEIRHSYEQQFIASLVALRRLPLPAMQAEMVRLAAFVAHQLWREFVRARPPGWENSIPALEILRDSLGDGK